MNFRINSFTQRWDMIVKSQSIIKQTTRILVLSIKGTEIEPSDKLRSLQSKYKGLDLTEQKLNKIAWVLDQLITSLLLTGQLENRFKSKESDSIKIEILFDELEAVESSAKRSKNACKGRWQMSFMKVINKRGPKTDPWGTPTLSASGLDLAPSKVVIEKRLDK